MGIEQPRCTLCHHRRIFHFRMIANKRTQREIMTHCSLPDCDCIVYIPEQL